MICSKIKITKKGASVEYLQEAPGGQKRTVYTSKESPLPDLPAALAAFRNYVLDLCELPKDWFDTLVITTLSIREPDENGLRGLIVHFHRGMEKANGRVMLSATPFLPEAGDETSDNIRVLDDATIEMIEAAERAAERYVNGEHGEQIDAFSESDEGDGSEQEEPEVEDDKPKRKRSRQLAAVE
jgi:hypothetical protein